MIFKKILCLLFGHIPIEGNQQDMFGHKYLWQKIYCKRCGRKLN